MRDLDLCAPERIPDAGQPHSRVASTTHQRHLVHSCIYLLSLRRPPHSAGAFGPLPLSPYALIRHGLHATPMGLRLRAYPLRDALPLPARNVTQMEPLDLSERLIRDKIVV